MDITTPCAMVIPAIDAVVTVIEGGTVDEKNDVPSAGSDHH